MPLTAAGISSNGYAGGRARAMRTKEGNAKLPLSAHRKRRREMGWAMVSGGQGGFVTSSVVSLSQFGHGLLVRIGGVSRGLTRRTLLGQPLLNLELAVAILLTPGACVGDGEIVVRSWILRFEFRRRL